MAFESPIRQHAFPLDEYALDEELLRVAHAYIAGLGKHGNDMRARIEAVLAVRKHLEPKEARRQAYRWFGAKPPTRKNPGLAELWRYISDKQKLLREREQLTEGELVAKGRRVYDHAVGDRPLRKSNVVRLEDGTALVEDLEVRDPSLPAANAALELLRKIGGFGVERTETRFSGVVGVANLSPEQREARVNELAEKAGMAPVPGLPMLPRRSNGSGASDAEDAG